MISDQPVIWSANTRQSENLEDQSGYTNSTAIPEFMTTLQQGLITFPINILSN